MARSYIARTRLSGSCEERRGRRGPSQCTSDLKQANQITNKQKQQQNRSELRDLRGGTAGTPTVRLLVPIVYTRVVSMDFVNVLISMPGPRNNSNTQQLVSALFEGQQQQRAAGRPTAKWALVPDSRGPSVSNAQPTRIIVMNQMHPQQPAAGSNAAGGPSPPPRPPPRPILDCSQGTRDERKG